ncbi:protein E6A [Equid gammaherpesvirus 2]|nr:protein E6A [Equid gammaherpesvirus 2]
MCWYKICKGCHHHRLNHHILMEHLTLMNMQGMPPPPPQPPYTYGTFNPNETVKLPTCVQKVLGESFSCMGCFSCTSYSWGCSCCCCGKICKNVTIPLSSQ